MVPPASDNIMRTGGGPTKTSLFMLEAKKKPCKTGRTEEPLKTGGGFVKLPNHHIFGDQTIHQQIYGKVEVVWDWCHIMMPKSLKSSIPFFGEKGLPAIRFVSDGLKICGCMTLGRSSSWS